MSLLHSVSVTTAASSLRSPSGTVIATSRGVRDTDSRTSITVSSRAHRITLVRGATRWICSASALRPLLVEVQDHHVRLQALGLGHDPLGLALQSDHVDAVLLEHRTQADRHDRRQVPEHDPKCGGSIHGVKPPEPCSRGERVDRAACDAHSVTSCARRAPSRRRVLPARPRGPRAHPGPRAWPPSRRRSAVRAISRYAPGRMRSKRKRPSPSVAAHSPASGTATQAPATGSPSASRTVPPMRVELGHRARRARRRAARGRLRPHLRAAHERRAGLDGDVHRRSRSTPCTVPPTELQKSAFSSRGRPTDVSAPASREPPLSGPSASTSAGSRL